jgi:TolA-binding protein
LFLKVLVARAFAWLPAVLALLLPGGCGSDAKTRENLSAGYGALEARQYEQAISRADAQLQQHPRGAGSAEAYYLRGRALEQKPAASQQEARANLQAARENYRQALQQRPAEQLETYVRTSMANCAYFLDDYTSAAAEWTAVYEKLSEPAIRSWVLYRVGICRQRLGQFDLADQIFAMVQEQYPGTVPATRAREHQGARGFSVQFATFANPATADSAMTTLRRQGVLPVKTFDAAQRTTSVRAGPLPSYQQALALKQRFADVYPDAMILP